MNRGKTIGMVTAGGIVFLVLVGGGCGLFEPREPESPSQGGTSILPATDPDAVIENLQTAITGKNVQYYTQCFPTAGRERQPFQFTPASGAAALFSGVFAHWSVDEERIYFQNMVAQVSAKPSAISNLQLSNKTVLVNADSAIYSFSYLLVFQHMETSLPDTARGTMQITLAPDLANSWVVYRWTDFKTTSDITWSYFKGKFSN